MVRGLLSSFRIVLLDVGAAALLALMAIAGGPGCRSDSGGGAGPDPLGRPVAGCSDLTRSLARYQGREIELCGPADLEFIEMIPIGKGQFLVRRLLHDVLELWSTRGGSRLPDGPRSAYVWTTFPTSTLLVGLRGDRVLAYDQQTGKRDLYTVDTGAAGSDDPLAVALSQSQLPALVTGRDFAALDDDHVLDWQAGTGDFQVWIFDRAHETSVPLVRSAFSGSRDDFKRGHRLVPLGGGRLLEWQPLTGRYRVLSFSWQDGSGDPFSPVPAAEGTWADRVPRIGGDHEILVIDDDKLLLWDRATGDLELRALDPGGTDPLSGVLLDGRTYDRLRSVPHGWGTPPSSPALPRVVLVLQRGRSFDHYFGRYCRAVAGSAPCAAGADCCEAMPASTAGAPECWQIDPARDEHVPDESPSCVAEKIDGGKMDRFAVGDCGDPRDFACVVPGSAGQMGVYHDLAAGGALADRYFQSALIEPELQLIYFAKGSLSIRQSLAEQGGEAITSLLAAHRVPWALYLGNPLVDNMSQLPPKFYDARWSHFRWLTELAHDIDFQELAPISVVIAPDELSEAPGKGPPARGAALVQEISDSIGRSPRYGSETLILITHLTAGGFYDHVPPPATVDPRVDPGQLAYGPRVPFLAIGPPAKVDYISHVPMELASITRFLEWNWVGGLTGQLQGRDAVVNDICDLLKDETGCGAPPSTP